MWNKSTTYILPLLGYKFSKKQMDCLKNTYIFFEDTECCLFITLKIEDSPTFEDLITYLINRNDFLDTIGVSDDEITIVIQIKDEISYRMFIDGKYSLMSHKAKKQILAFYTPLATTKFVEKVRSILFKKEELRAELSKQLGVELPKTAELSSIINIEDERYEF